MDTQDALPTFIRETADIVRLNNWIFDIIFPYVHGRTLELGSGNGGVSSLFIERGLPIHLTDEDDINRETLRKRFQGISFLRMIHDIDFNQSSFEMLYADRARAFSTVIAVNITEHGGYTEIMLDKAKYFLESGGHFMVITSARAALFNNLAINLQGLKEYNYQVARNLMGDAFQILKVRYFDWSPGAECLEFDKAGLYTLAICRKKAL